jgi:hypothetical protein
VTRARSRATLQSGCMRTCVLTRCVLVVRRYALPHVASLTFAVFCTHPRLAKHDKGNLMGTLNAFPQLSFRARTPLSTHLRCHDRSLDIRCTVHSVAPSDSAAFHPLSARHVRSPHIYRTAHSSARSLAWHSLCTTHCHNPTHLQATFRAEIEASGFVFDTELAVPELQENYVMAFKKK